MLTVKCTLTQAMWAQNTPLRGAKNQDRMQMRVKETRICIYFSFTTLVPRSGVFCVQVICVSDKAEEVKFFLAAKSLKFFIKSSNNDENSL